MIAAHELAVSEPAFALVLIVVAGLTAIGCHLHRDQARARHHERKNGGLG